MPIEPTPKDVLFRDGTAQVYRFRQTRDAGGPAPKPGGMPVLLVPSMINRWYVLDLRPGASLSRALVDEGLDTWCLDWGIPQDEDRYLSWDDVQDRLSRVVRFLRRATGAPKVGILGYCMGATLSGIFTATHAADVAAFVNLAGPFDFSQGGLLSTMVDRRWFDVDAVADAGNVAPSQMQDGFVALRPTQPWSKIIAKMETAFDPKARASFEALDEWASDNIPFPASAYRTYIRELYQQNGLMTGEHRVRGKRVDLANITCPVLTVAAERDAICPLPAARALNERCGTTDHELIVVPGGHVGAVVGSKASKVLYPAISNWLRRKLCN